MFTIIWHKNTVKCGCHKQLSKMLVWLQRYCITSKEAVGWPSTAVHHVYRQNSLLIFPQLITEYCRVPGNDILFGKPFMYITFMTVTNTGIFRHSSPTLTHAPLLHLCTHAPLLHMCTDTSPTHATLGHTHTCRHTSQHAVTLACLICQLSLKKRPSLSPL